MRTISAIQADIDSTEAAVKAGGVDQSQIDVWNMQIADFKVEMKTVEDQLQAQQHAEQERVQAQTEKVESITLPYDYNEIFDNPTANDNIIAVVKQFQRQAYDEHNAEVTRINAEWTDKLNSGNAVKDALIEQLSGLHQDIQSLTNDLEGEKTMYGELEANYVHLQTILNQANLDKADAESKRDNAIQQATDATNAAIQAVNEQNALKAQIEALQQELTAKKALTVNGNDKLAELASKAKESTIEKANRGLQRWGLPTLEVPSMPAEPLAMPEIPAAQEEHPKDEVSDGNTEGNPAVEGNTAIPQSLGERTAAEETTLTGRYNPFPQTGDHATDIINLQMAHLDLIDQVNALKTSQDSTALTVAKIAEKANLPLSA